MNHIRVNSVRVAVVILITALLMSGPLTAKAHAAQLISMNLIALQEPVLAFDYEINVGELNIVTEEQLVKIPLSAFYQFPVEKHAFKGISTRFTRGHPGVDLRAELKSEIKPIQDGIVEVATNVGGGYGKYVVIAHKNGLRSLYAHLGEIYVKAGDEVKMDQAIGTVGLTGRTTGAHLHLEIHTAEAGYINPEKVIDVTKVK